MTIIVEKRSSDYIAYVKGAKTMWGQGKSVYEAIGSLITTFPKEFNVVIQTP